MLARALWVFLQESKAPFEQTFFDLYGGRIGVDRLAASPSASFYEAPSFALLKEVLASFSPAPGTRLDHPYFQRATPCTMLIDEVEAIWDPIARADDWSRFHAKLDAIAEMADAYGTEATPAAAS